MDSVVDPGSVQAMRAALEDTAKGLPFMQDKVPTKWLTVRDILQSLKEQRVNLKHPLLEEISNLMRARDVAMTNQELWNAVEFWGLLGEIKVYHDTIVLNVV